ncbi:ATP-binding protein [Mesorhizobium sp. YM1C-6-2]|uniref:ATP-binding protein n=1 Tax=Mesorhizobium sp. YM1C-6-2 TaxID=1827501 RepID=UPI000EF29093|nr:ATP-binding protein [Mesorhizobium sp. YM1C-6-2]RLP22969.1 PAS domain S-box protein [Mesorhizobium sp. YM1C-6-2]
MAQASYSFLDVAALDEVRERFAAGDALVILSDDLGEMIWANGPGAALFGHADVETALGAEAPLGAAAKRQIAATSGFPDIGRDRALLVRVASGMSSWALQFLASAVTLPDGERAILLAQPASVGGADDDISARAIGGFSAAGHFLAFIDREGGVEAAAPGFARLGLAKEALADMVSEARERQPIVKRMLQGRRGALPAGLARLTDERHLLVVIDENFADEPEEEAAAATPTDTGALDVEAAAEAAVLAGQPPVREIWYLGSTDGAGRPETEEPSIEAVADAVPPPTEAPELGGPMEIEPASGQAMAEPENEASSVPAEAAGPEGVEDEAARPEVAEAAVVARESEAPQEAVSETQAQKEAAPQAPPQEAQPAQRASGPVRFVWRTDADGKFSQISREFSLAVGELAADIVGRRFHDVANAFGFDATGEIAGLLARRDTWSGRSVAWPVAGTDLKIPVDLAALPVYDRNRNFEGFRGFGVARTGDAMPDPEGIGLVLVRLPETEPDATPRRAEDAATAAEPKPAKDVPRDDNATTDAADPFHGEKPALAVASAPDRRFSDKIIRLAEHRHPANDRGPNGNGGERSLSAGERITFQQIGERLKKESGASATPETESKPKPEAGPAEAEKRTEVSGAAPAREAGRSEPPAGEQAVFEEPDDATVDAEDVAALQALDGVTDEAADLPEKTVSEAFEQVASTGEARAAEPEAVPPATEAGEASEPKEPVTPPAKARKSGRPGMSLLDFAQWGKDEPAGPASDDAPKSAAMVEMEEAAALDGHTLPVAQEEAPAEVSEPAPAEPGGEAPAAAGSADAETRAAEPVGIEPLQADETDAEAAEETRAADVAAAGEAEAAAASPAEAGAGLSILERLPVPLLVHSGDRLHYANDEFFALTGYRSIEELADAGGIGVLFADPYEDEAGDEHDPGPRQTDRHMRLKTKGGEEFPVQAFLQSVPWEGGKALLLVLSRAREGTLGSGQSPLIAELEARVAEMRTIIDTATDGVVLIARDGSIRSISRPAEALFGMDSDDVAGKSFASLFAIESQKAAGDYLNGLTDHGVASVLNDGREVIGREAEGRFIPLFMTIGKLPGDSGYCAVVRDITQWKRAEEELTQARATAERASSHKTEFLARISHEIRTPLNAIIGFSELMLDEKFGPVANDRYRDYLRDINRSGNHVLDLVNDLLDISKIEAGQQEMAYEAVSLNETLAETVALMQPQANRERVIIRSSFASKLPDVVADLRSVRQIALNILSNAVRYTQAGGQVIVSTAYEAQGEVVLRVRDTGIGMTPAEIEQALKPFKQINSLKRTRGDGTGLGLPLTKAMVEANRARFSIHSTPGEGTLVEVAFPPTRVLAD